MTTTIISTELVNDLAVLVGRIWAAGDGACDTAIVLSIARGNSGEDSSYPTVEDFLLSEYEAGKRYIPAAEQMDEYDLWLIANHL